MPSLRRTVSSPAVRPSPYPTTLSVGNSSSAVAANRPRRTNSETAGRRVLADIDWWRVLDGQQAEDLDADRDQEQSPRVVQDETDASVPSIEQDLLPFAGVDIVRLMSPASQRVELSSEVSTILRRVSHHANSTIILLALISYDAFRDDVHIGDRAQHTPTFAARAELVDIFDRVNAGTIISARRVSRSVGGT